jgi:hypothetical protein
MLNLLQYLYCCYRAYKSPNKLTYFALEYRGVPCLTVAIGRDREAWRVSQFAIESLQRTGLDRC